MEATISISVNVSAKMKRQIMRPKINKTLIFSATFLTENFLKHLSVCHDIHFIFDGGAKQFACRIAQHASNGTEGLPHLLHSHLLLVRTKAFTFQMNMKCGMCIICAMCYLLYVHHSHTATAITPTPTHHKKNIYMTDEHKSWHFLPSVSSIDTVFTLCVHPQLNHNNLSNFMSKTNDKFRFLQVHQTRISFHSCHLALIS